jgi:hypothetical protein
MSLPVAATTTKHPYKSAGTFLDYKIRLGHVLTHFSEGVDKGSSQRCCRETVGAPVSAARFTPVFAGLAAL